MTTFSFVHRWTGEVLVTIEAETLPKPVVSTSIAPISAG